MNIPTWILELALKNAHAVTLSGLVNGEWHTVNGTALPMMHFSEDNTLNPDRQFNIEQGGMWVRLSMEGLEVRSEQFGTAKTLILIFKQGVTVRIDFRA